jgi:hypothetical protein
MDPLLYAWEHDLDRQRTKDKAIRRLVEIGLKVKMDLELLGTR